MEYVKKEAVEALLHDAENGYICLDKLLYQLKGIESVSVPRINGVAAMVEVMNKVITDCSNTGLNDESKSNRQWYVKEGCNHTILEQMTRDAGIGQVITRKSASKYGTIMQKIGYKKRGKNFRYQETPISILELTRFLNRILRDMTH